MEIIKAKSAGFCYGVDRAVEMVMKYANDNEKVYTMGPIIHNAHMVEYLYKRGVIAIENYKDLNDEDIIIIRAHGVSPEIKKDMEDSGLIVYDATCPYVKKIHGIVKKECGKRKILIIGDRNHAEIKGIKGYCKDNSIVIYTKEEAESLDIQESEAVVVAQTTITREKWDEIIGILEKKVEKLLKFDTICSETAKRQSEAKEIASKVDLMIVIGCKNSSNTQKLYELCRKYCNNTYQIEIWEDLKNIDFREIKKVGITAGASTPEWIIKEVLQEMEEKIIKNANETNVDNEVKEEVKDNLEAVVENSKEADVESVEEAKAEDVKKVKDENVEEAKAEDTEEESDENTEEMDMEKAYEDSMVSIRNGEVVAGRVMGYNTKEVYIDIGYKADGIIKLDEFLEKKDFDPEKELAKGNEIEVYVVKINDGEGNVLLSKSRVDEIKGLQELSSAYKEKETVEVYVKEITKGGVIADYKSINIFIPASQISDRFERDLDKYLNATLRVRITEINRRKRRYIGSSRIVIEEEKQSLLKEFWENVEIDKLYTGTVKSITDFGVFVDLGGVDGLVHVSELSWVKINHPKDVVKIGDKLDVRIKKFDKESGRISLGYKKLEDSPWEIAKNNYSAGDIVKGKVIRIVPFGAFIELDKGIDALVHISQISNRRIADAKDVLEIGQEVEGKIIEIDFEVKKISISIKEVKPIDPPETEEEKEHRETVESSPKSHSEDMSVNISDLIKDKED